MGADKGLRDRSWERIRAYLTVLGADQGLTGRSWGALGASWAAPGRSWGLLGRSWGLLGRSQIENGPQRVPTWPQDSPKMVPKGFQKRPRIDSKIDPKIDPKSSRIRDGQSGPNTTPVDVSEESERRPEPRSASRQNYQT